MKFSALQISTIAALILVFIIHQYGFKKGVPTCNNYVINTYLYLALSVTLLGIAIQTIKWSPFESNSVMPTFVSINHFIRSHHIHFSIPKHQSKNHNRSHSQSHILGSLHSNNVLIHIHLLQRPHFETKHIQSHDDGGIDIHHIIFCSVF